MGKAFSKSGYFLADNSVNLYRILLLGIPTDWFEIQPYEAFLFLGDKLACNCSIRSLDVEWTTFNGLNGIAFPFALAFIIFNNLSVYSSLKFFGLKGFVNCPIKLTAIFISSGLLFVVGKLSSSVARISSGKSQPVQEKQAALCPYYTNVFSLTHHKGTQAYPSGFCHSIS